MTGLAYKAGVKEREILKNVERKVETNFDKMVG
jgi:hypothetical protein